MASWTPCTPAPPCPTVLQRQEGQRAVSILCVLRVLFPLYAFCNRVIFFFTSMSFPSTILGFFFIYRIYAFKFDYSIEKVLRPLIDREKRF